MKIGLLQCDSLDEPHVGIDGDAPAVLSPLAVQAARLIARRKLKRGIASLCIGGGEATAVAVELV